MKLYYAIACSIMYIHMPLIGMQNNNNDDTDNKKLTINIQNPSTEQLVLTPRTKDLVNPKTGLPFLNLDPLALVKQETSTDPITLEAQPVTAFDHALKHKGFLDDVLGLRLKTEKSKEKQFNLAWYHYRRFAKYIKKISPNDNNKNLQELQNAYHNYTTIIGLQHYQRGNTMLELAETTKKDAEANLDLEQQLQQLLTAKAILGQAKKSMRQAKKLDVKDAENKLTTIREINLNLTRSTRNSPRFQELRKEFLDGSNKHKEAIEKFAKARTALEQINKQQNVTAI